jgi:hypothetical protein
MDDILRRLGHEDAAEDVVQATLVIAMRKIGSWRGEASGKRRLAKDSRQPAPPMDMLRVEVLVPLVPL